MRFTSEDIRQEQDAALASLTPAQRRAIDRLARARRLSAFNHRRTEENLQTLFAVEAEARSLSAASRAA